MNWTEESTKPVLISVFNQNATKELARNDGFRSGRTRRTAPWGLVLPLPREFRVNYEAERARIFQVLRDAHLFLIESPEHMNYYAGWLLQAGRIPNRTEFFFRREEAESALASMTEAAPTNRDPSEIAFALPQGFVCARPSRFFLPVLATRAIVIGAQLESRYRIPEAACSAVKIWLKSVSAASTVHVTVSVAAGPAVTLLELSNWEEGWKELTLPSSFRRSPGELFSVVVHVVVGTVEVGVSDRSNAALLASDPQKTSPAPFAINFVPGKEGNTERFFFLARRAISLLRQGDLNRLWFALKRRLPGLR